jgi:hypothetical protein
MLLIPLVATAMSVSGCAITHTVSSGQSDSTSPSGAGPAATQGAPLPSLPSQFPLVQVPPAVKAMKAQLGVQVYWHTSGSAEDVRTAADRVLNYIVGLGANSVGLTFPIYTDGVHPTRVYTVSGSTPDPASLGIVITEAAARGLRITLRPLIDEANIKDAQGDWRGTIQPVDIGAWFSSYWSVLKPYVQLAQQDSVNGFVVAAELNSLVYQKSQWQSLDAQMSQIYSGELEYADNWDIWKSGGSYSPAPTIGVDAYPTLGLPDDASVAQLTDAWNGWLHNRSSATLASTVLQEVGIAPTTGAYSHPATWAVPGQKVVPAIQINWFAAACHAAQDQHMAGIYYWDVDSNADPASPAAATVDAGTIIGRGDQSIKACFAAGWGG